MTARTVADVVATPTTEFQEAVNEFLMQLGSELLPIVDASANVDGVSFAEAREQLLSQLRDAFVAAQDDNPDDNESHHGSAEPLDADALYLSQQPWFTHHRARTDRS